MLYKILVSFVFVNVVNGNNVTELNLKEGSKCPFNENITGTCVNFFKCTRLVLDMPDKRYPPICSFDGKVPIVCCTSCELVPNINNAVIVSSGYHYWKRSNGKDRKWKSHDKCLDYAKHAVGKCTFEGRNYLLWKESQKCYSFETFGYFASGGRSAKTGEMPHMVECLDYAKHAVGKCTFEGRNYLLWKESQKCYSFETFGYFASGGRSAKTGEMPHMALLGYGNELESVEWNCGGSLISEKFILTAGHCVKSDLLGPVTYAALGILKRDDPQETWQRYKIKTIIPHPEYRPPVKYHDIALLETEERVRLSKLVIPGCLPGINQYVHDNASIKYSNQVAESLLSLTAAGWGALGFRQALANTLQVITVTSFNETECLEHYPPHTTIPHGYNKTTQLCFGDRKKPVDTCEGDSGGPLQDFNLYCTYTILGVTSFGRACGFAGSAGIYTRVVHYVPWIESIIWRDE